MLYEIEALTGPGDLPSTSGFHSPSCLHVCAGARGFRFDGRSHERDEARAKEKWAMTDPIFPPRLQRIHRVMMPFAISYQAGRRDAAEPDRKHGMLWRLTCGRDRPPGRGPSSGHGVTWRRTRSSYSAPHIHRPPSILAGWTTSQLDRRRFVRAACAHRYWDRSPSNVRLRRSSRPSQPTMQVSRSPLGGTPRNQSAAAPRTSPAASTTTTTSAVAEILRDELALVEAARSALAKGEPDPNTCARSMSTTIATARRRPR